MGGIDTILPELIKGLDRDKYRSIVALPQDGDYVARYLESGAAVVFIEFSTIQRNRSLISSLCSFARIFQSVLKLYRLIKVNRIAIVHTQKFNTLDGDIAARFAGVKSVHSIHEHPAPPIVVWRLLSRLIYLLVDRIIVTCDASFREVPELSVRRKKVRKVYNGVAIPLLGNGVGVNRSDILRCSICQNTKVIGMVARLAPNKGQMTLLRAVPLVLAEFPDTQFAIVGDITSKTSWETEYRESLFKFAKEIGAENAIHFLGKRVDLYPILQALDIFVHPASSDILPTVVFQAMAIGKPVVVTSVGGLPEIVSHNVTGKIIPPDMPEALADTILWMLKNPEESRQMGIAAQKEASTKFSREAYVENTELIYRELVNSPQALWGL